MKENIRFELAHGENRSYYTEIENGKKRALILFDEVFKNLKTVQLILTIPQYTSKTKLKRYLYKNQFKLIDSFITHSWNTYYDGETTVLIIETAKANLRVVKIIDGICYKDFPQHRRMRIKNSVVFYNSQDNLILNVYDDRGCDIWSSNLKRQKEIYDKYNSWIPKYDKIRISNFYDSIM